MKGNNKQWSTKNLPSTITIMLATRKTGEQVETRGKGMAAASRRGWISLGRRWTTEPNSPLRDSAAGRLAYVRQTLRHDTNFSGTLIRTPQSLLEAYTNIHQTMFFIWNLTSQWILNAIVVIVIKRVHSTVVATL